MYENQDKTVTAQFEYDGITMTISVSFTTTRLTVSKTSLLKSRFCLRAENCLPVWKTKFT